MPVPDDRLLPARCQPLQPVLADRLQHPEARLAGSAVVPAKQAAFRQPGETVEHSLLVTVSGNSLGSVERESTDKDGKSPKELLLIRERRS